jgi:copper ion binding protein
MLADAAMARPVVPNRLALIPLGGIRYAGFMTFTTVTVTGMTCGHCAASVREELGEISGVTAVGVDVASGAVTIDSVAPVDASEIRTAVEDAGYRLAS